MQYLKESIRRGYTKRLTHDFPRLQRDRPFPFVDVKNQLLQCILNRECDGIVIQKSKETWRRIPVAQPFRIQQFFQIERY